jgi:mono/diheme cytochrome c family protein
MSVLRWLMIGSALAAMAAARQSLAQEPGAAGGKSVERGRYVVKIGGCNDCHTSGYTQSGGRVPEKLWLAGDRLGWRGPWGTTYPSNLRMYVRTVSEDEWVKIAKTAQYRPPMPWFALHAMTEQDLRAVYRFIRYLGPAGEAVPDFVPFGQEPKGPYVQFPQPPP